MIISRGCEDMFRRNAENAQEVHGKCSGDICHCLREMREMRRDFEENDLGEVPFFTCFLRVNESFTVFSFTIWNNQV